MIRPPVERYIRCTMTCGAFTAEPGLEWRAGDSFDDVTDKLRGIAELAAERSGWYPDPMAAARSVEPLFDEEWPGRAWFIELHDTQGRWTQIFQPFGVPVNVVGDGLMPRPAAPG